MYVRLRHLFASPRPRMAYLPSDFVRQSPYFSIQRTIYERYGIELDDLVDVTNGFEQEQLVRLQDYDGLHLSGGQTPRFLNLLRAHQLIPHLQAFAHRGGVLAGTSAGAILLTPTIETAQAVGDDFTAAPQDLTALGLVEFHFWPHFEAGDQEAANRQARELGAALYAAADGSGVIVEGDQVDAVGAVVTFRS